MKKYKVKLIKTSSSNFKIISRWQNVKSYFFFFISSYDIWGLLSFDAFIIKHFISKENIILLVYIKKYLQRKSLKSQINIIWLLEENSSFLFYIFSYYFIISLLFPSKYSKLFCISNSYSLKFHSWKKVIFLLV